MASEWDPGATGLAAWPDPGHLPLVGLHAHIPSLPIWPGGRVRGTGGRRDWTAAPSMSRSNACEVLGDDLAPPLAHLWVWTQRGFLVLSSGSGPHPWTRAIPEGR